VSRHPEFPMMPDYVPRRTDGGGYDFSGLSLPQLKECWVVCERQKAHCHADSCFQPLIDADMRELVPLLKKAAK
jgi:hypothetical protein